MYFRSDTGIGDEFPYVYFLGAFLKSSECYIVICLKKKIPGISYPILFWLNNVSPTNPSMQFKLILHLDELNIGFSISSLNNFKSSMESLLLEQVFP